MKEEKDKDQEKKAEDWPLPHCTKAPAAEHARANDEDEPCDDSRGNVDEKKKTKT